MKMAIKSSQDLDELRREGQNWQKSEHLKLIILIFHVKKFNNYCELDVRVIVCNV